MAFRWPKYQVLVNGTDYTSRFAPRVKSISIDDKKGDTSDRCKIELADPDGEIVMPIEGDALEVYLDEGDGFDLGFSGTIDEVTSNGSRGGGRELTIGAKGIDATGDIRAPVMRSKQDDNGIEFGTVAQEWGKKAGLKEIKVSPELAKLKREYWSMQGESFLAWGRSVADEIGATFKVQGGKAVFAEEAEGKTASGDDMPTVRAAWGENLLKWDISPVLSRAKAKRVSKRYYDAKEAKWKEVEVEVGGNRGRTKHVDRGSAAGSNEAGQRAKSLKGKSKKESGDGTVDIVGTLSVKPGVKLQPVGLRDGIDGIYIIETVSHKISRKGWTSTCSIKKPSDGAGADSRNPKAKASSGSATATSSNNSALNSTGGSGSSVG